MNEIAINIKNLHKKYDETVLYRVLIYQSKKASFMAYSDQMVQENLLQLMQLQVL